MLVCTEPFPQHKTKLAVGVEVYIVHRTNTIFLTVSVGVYNEQHDNTVVNVSVY